MSNTGSLGPVGPTNEPPELSEMAKQPGGEDLMHAKVRTLSDLKNVLIQYLGEEKGKKFYNQFLQSFAMMMLQQVQQSADQARKAAQNMRMDSGLG